MVIATAAYTDDGNQQRDEDGPGDDPPRIPHFLAEGRNAGVAGVGKEDQSGGLGDPVPTLTGRRGTPPRDVRLAAGPGGNDGEHEGCEHDETRIAVTRAVRVTPRQVMAVITATVPTATGRCHAVGMTYATTVRAIAAQLAILPRRSPSRRYSPTRSQALRP